MDGMMVSMTVVDAEGNELDAAPGETPPDMIGAVAETPTGWFVAVPATPETQVIDGNLGAYKTFGLAVEALRSNHRREWTRQERREARGLVTATCGASGSS
jgi:hypothetical protein